MKKNIYVIIVTWNGMKWIERCLDALRLSTYPVSIVVIDNGSKDDTVHFIKNNYPEVHLIQSDKNLGFGQANNEGMRYALSHGCDYVYLLNQDAYVYPDMFEKLLEQSEKPENQRKYAIYSPLHINSDIHKLDKQFKGYLNSISPTIVEDFFLNKVKSVYPVDGVPAAGWLLPKFTLENIGGFDPIFFHYGEDHHYFQRVLYHGYKTGLVATAKMIHDRDGFGNRDLAMKNVLFRSLKTEIFLNITLSKSDILRKLSNLFILFTYQSIKVLFNGNISMILEYQKSFVKNLLLIKKYSEDRAINKQKGANWL